MLDETITIDIERATLSDIERATLSDIDKTIKRLERLKQEKAAEYKARHKRAVQEAAYALAKDFPDMEVHIGNVTFNARS